MRTTKREMKRKGFTLVELLIVIVVIGVLSAMMMLSSTEAVSSAKAADIVSDLRNLKTAALAYYADHLDAIDNVGKETNGYKFTNLQTNSADVLKYLGSTLTDGKYKFSNGTNEIGSWYVYYDEPDTKVGEKLKGRAKSVGLYKSQSTAATEQYAGTGKVYMFIR